MSSSPGIKIAALAGVVALVIVLYARSGHQPPPGDSEQATAGDTSPARQQVEQRLKQLSAAHDRTTQERQSAAGAVPGGQIDARGAVAPNLKRVPAQRPNGPAASNPSDPGEASAADLDVDPDDIPALKAIALKDTDPERRLAAVTMLGASEDPAVVPTLAQALSDEDDEVRMAAIQALSDFTGDAPIDLLSKVVVDDPSADNRYEALEVLSDLGGERAATAIQKALNDPDEDVRSLAEGMLDMEDTYQDEPQNAADAPTPATQQAPTP